MSVFAAIATGIGSVANSLINNHYASKQAKQQNKYNIQQWQRENEYNTPKNQMARLQEAGLNPNLVYGNGTVAGNTSSSMAGKMVAPRWEVDLGNYLNYKQLALNNEKIEQDIDNQKALADAGVDKMRAETKRLNSETDVLLGDRRSLLRAELRKMNAEIGFLTGDFKSYNEKTNRFAISPYDSPKVRALKSAYNGGVDALSGFGSWFSKHWKKGKDSVRDLDLVDSNGKLPRPAGVSSKYWN